MQAPDEFVGQLSGNFWRNLWNGVTNTANTITNVSNAIQGNGQNNNGGNAEPTVIVVPSNNSTTTQKDNTMLYVGIGVAAVGVMAAFMLMGKKR